MFNSIITLCIGIAIGVIYHATIGPWAKDRWQRFRAWRLGITRQQ